MKVYNALRKKKFSTIGWFKFLTYASQAVRGGRIKAAKAGIILNCGGPRSGSTLLNMMIKELILLSIKKQDSYVDNLMSYRDRKQKYQNLTLLKTHRYFADIGGAIRRGEAKVFMTHRDLRDVVVSLRQKGWMENLQKSVESGELKQMAFSAMAYASINGVNVISYEDIKDRPKETLINVAHELEIPLVSEEAIDIVRKFGIENIKVKIEEMSHRGSSEDTFDRASGLHKNHVADALTGKWRRELTEVEANLIYEECREYFEFFRYRK